MSSTLMKVVVVLVVVVDVRVCVWVSLEREHSLYTQDVSPTPEEGLCLGEFEAAERTALFLDVDVDVKRFSKAPALTSILISDMWRYLHKCRRLARS